MIELSVSLNFFGMGREFSTFVVKSCIVLARYFLRVGPRAVFMGVWRHFHEGSNFWILTLFGSGYAGLGLVHLRLGEHSSRNCVSKSLVAFRFPRERLV